MSFLNSLKLFKTLENVSPQEYKQLTGGDINTVELLKISKNA